MNNFLVFSLVFLLLITACKKDEDSLHAPVISLVTMQPNQVTEFVDSIVFTISYDDVDGDIGFPNADSNSLYLKDIRLANADSYFVPPLAPLDQNLHIKGEFRIVLPNTFRLGQGPQEITSYSIWLKDRKGNISNVITTPNLTILQQ